MARIWNSLQPGACYSSRNYWRCLISKSFVTTSMVRLFGNTPNYSDKIPKR